MRQWRSSLLLLLYFFMFLSTPTLVRAETWKIVTLDWPPYTDEQVPENGAAAVAFRETMKTVGVDIEYIYMPWSRGTFEVKKEQYAGLFPVWKNESFRGGKNSPALFTSPLGFVHNKAKIHPWKTLSDFKGLDIGTVSNYGYSPEFLALGAQGVYNLKPVSTDEQNLRMLSFKRIDLTIVDLLNARCLTEIRHPELRSKLYFDPQIYMNAELFISLRDDGKFSARTAQIKQALKNRPMQPRIDELIRKIHPTLSHPETKQILKPAQ